MKKEYKLKESFKPTRKPISRIIHIDNNELNSTPYFFYFSDCGYEYNETGYYHERENGIGYMFTYTLSGVAELIYENKKHLLHKGDLCMIDLNKKNILRVINNNHWEIYFIHIIGANIEELYQVLNQYSGIIKHDFNPEKIEQCVESLLNKINIYDASSLIYETVIDAIKQSTNSTYDNFGINKAINYIYNNYKDDLSIDEISTEIGFSKFHFIRKFKEVIGIPPKQFITELRVKKAKELLTTTNFTISEIAAQCGFISSKNMNYSFEKIYGIGPREYQKNK